MASLEFSTKELSTFQSFYSDEEGGQLKNNIHVNVTSKGLFVFVMQYVSFCVWRGIFMQAKGAVM